MSQSSAPDTSSEVEETDAAENEESERSSGRLPDPDDMSQEELDEIEAEREKRLDPENRPDGAEVDNTDRDFDDVHGEFTDSDHDQKLGPFKDPM